MTEIRCAVESDADRLFELVEAFATSFRPERPAFDESFQQLIHDDSALLMVAEERQSVVGYLLGFEHRTFFANGKVAWVEELMVAEDHRRKGTGRALVRGIEEWARARGSKLVALATRRAASFYLALGYAESATYFRKLLL